jgi:hypothetical protein
MTGAWLSQVVSSARGSAWRTRRRRAWRRNAGNRMTGSPRSLCRRTVTRGTVARGTVDRSVVTRRLRSGRSRCATSRDIDSRMNRRPRDLAEPGRQRLPRSRKNLPGPGRGGTRFGWNGNAARPWRGQRRGNWMSGAGGERRTYRRNDRTQRRKTCGSFHAHLGGFHGNFGDPGGRGKLRLALALIAKRRFIVEDGDCRGFAPRGLFHRRFTAQAPPHHHDLIVLQRTGVRLLIGDSQVRKQLKDRAGLNFQFPSQLVDANFAHTLRLWRGIASRARSLVFPGPSFSTYTPSVTDGSPVSIVTDCFSDSSAGKASSAAASSAAGAASEDGSGAAAPSIEFSNWL